MSLKPNVFQRARLKASLTQPELSALCGVSQPVLSRWDYSVPAVVLRYARACRALGITVDAALRGAL